MKSYNLIHYDAVQDSYWKNRLLDYLSSLKQEKHRLINNYINNFNFDDFLSLQILTHDNNIVAFYGISRKQWWPANVLRVGTRYWVDKNWRRGTGKDLVGKVGVLFSIGMPVLLNKAEELGAHLVFVSREDSPSGNNIFSHRIARLLDNRWKLEEGYYDVVGYENNWQKLFTYEIVPESRKMLQAFKMKGKIVNTRSQLNLRLQKVTLNSLNKSLPDINWRDMFSKGQFKSKEWLVEYLIRSTGTINDVVICGGWCGLLAQLLYLTKLNINSITSLDLEEKHTSAANSIIRNKSFKAITCDMHDFDYTKVDTVINTSCEHVENFSNWYDKVPQGRLVVLQSNNYFDHHEHINCVDSLEEFKKQCPMDIVFSGELELPLYKRFMLIGYK